MKTIIGIFTVAFIDKSSHRSIFNDGKLSGLGC